MKKIVPKLLVISSQILIGALFLIFTVDSKSEINLKVNSTKMERLSQFVYNDTLIVDKVEEISEKTDFEENVEVLVPENKIEKFETEDSPVWEDLSDVKEDIKEEKIEQEVVEIPDEKEDNYFMDRDVINTYTGILTGYGPDCVGCGNYKTNKVSTASGYHIADIVDGVIQPAFTITYDDSEFGEVRIVAADSTLPYKSIVRITIPEKDPIIAIVLDRGSTVGFENCKSPSGCLTNFDLLFAKESEALGKTFNVTFEILRMGA